MTFDLEGALNAGYSVTDIANFLAKEKGFDVAGARTAGYSDDDIVQELTKVTPKPKTGFVAGVKSGYESLKGNVGAIGAAMGVSGAEEYSREQQEKAAKEAQLPEFTDSPFEYAKTLLGQSIPYMAAPIAAAYATPAVTLGTVAGVTLTGATLTATAVGGIQAFGSNLSRQLAEGKTAKDLDIASAASAAPLQAALDTIGFRFIPGLRRVFGEAGVKLSDAQLREVMKARMTETLAEKILGYGTKTVQVAGVEGFTEAGQAVLERAQAGLNITDPEARKEYFDNFLGGAVLGGTISVPGRAVERGGQQSQFAQLQKQDAEMQQQNTETARKTEAYKQQAGTQLPLGQAPELGEGYDGYRMPPEPYRAAEETEGARQNKLFQITELRDQHDVLMRELDRLKQQYESPNATLEQKQEILDTAEAYNTARTDITQQIKQLSKGVKGTERAGAAPEPEQRGLDFEAPEMLRQQTGEGVVLGEEPAAPAGLTPEQTELFRQERINAIQARMNAGQTVTPADQAFLRMDEREQRALFEAQPTPELFTPEERPEFRLGPQYLQPSVAEVPAVEARPITEADFKTMGIGITNKKLREAILEKDLTDPVQREEVKELLTDFANDPKRSAKIIDGVNNFLSSPAFMEQAAFDFGKPKRTRAKKQEVADVIQPTESIEQPSEPSPTVAEQPREQPTTGIETPEPAGVDVTGEPVEQPIAGEAIQPTALAEEQAPTQEKLAPNQAVRRLVVEGKMSQGDARALVEDLTDGYGQVATADVTEQLDSLRGKFTPKEKYTPEQRANAEKVASSFGGKVVWQEGDNALIRGYSLLSGNPVYMAAKGTTHTKNDIESFTGNLFTPQERAQLVAEKKRQEYADTKKHKAAPFINFDKGHIQTSKNTPKGLGDIVTGWSKLLGLKANVYVTTIADARADADKFTGPHRSIGSAALDPSDIGSARRMNNGDYYIAFTASTSKTAMLETLAHELGHIHQKEMYNNASPELKTSIKKEFEKWLGTQKGKTARELVDALRAKSTAKQTAVDPDRTADSLKDYWRSFEEWYADQVSRWATTDAKPISVVEKFFARLGRALRTFFGNLKNNRYLANETFVQYLDKVKDSVVASGTVPDTGKAQAQRRSVETLTPEGEKAAALNERMKNIGNEPPPNIDQSFKERVTLHAGKAKSLPMKFRQAVVDKDAPVKEQLAAKFQNAVTNGLGDIRPDILNEQAQEATGLADQLMRKGGVRIGKDGLVEAYDRVEGGEQISLDRVFDIVVEDLGKKLGSPETAVTLAHRAFIAQRAAEINKRNAVREKEAAAAEAKGNTAAAKKLRAQIIRVRASQAEIDAGLEAMNAYPELKKAFDVFTKYNEGITDFLVATDRVSPAEAQSWKDNVGYVPWTRIEEEESKVNDLTKIRVGNAHLTSLPTLDKEGSSKEIRNVLDNMVGHTIWAIRSGMKNRAALKTLEQLPSTEELKTQDKVDTERKNNPQLVVFAYRGGERVAYKLQNLEDVPAFSDVIDVAGPILGVFKASSNILRGFITHMPTFALSQLSQDTVRAMFLSGVKHPFSLPTKVMKNFYKAVTNDASDMQALGITGSYDGMPDNAMRKMRERHGLQDRAVFKRFWDKLEDFSLAADMAVRAAIYDQTMQETGDRVMAFHRAKEYVNFKTQGNGQTVRILRQIVPFMNAYIQGMDVLYRTIQGKGISGADKKEAIALFLTTGMKVAALSTLYAMLVGDDEDYKGLDDRERDNSFIIPGTGLKLPVAPEIGFLFKVIPERLYQAIVREGTDRPVDATTFMRSMREAAVNAYGGMNITPQLVKPLIEVATNYSFFTGNPIVGIYMAGKETYLQVNSSTSELAKLLGYVGVSPLKVDHLVRGYLGTVGGVMLDVTDAVADPTRMNKPINKLPLIKTFMYDDTGRGYKSEFYNFRESVDKVVESVNAFKREGRTEELKEYLTEDNLKLYAMKGVVNKLEGTLGKLRQYRNIIANDPDLSGAEKREQTDNILQQEKEILKAYNVPQLKQMAGM